MSISSLILAVVLVCTFCIISLWLVQLKRQKAIEKARKTIIYNAQINQLLQIAETTAQYIDDQLILFLANRIDYSAQLLYRSKIVPDKRSQNTIEQAQNWVLDPKSLRKQARKGKKESQQKSLNLLKSIIQHIRQGVLEQQVSRSEAKLLAHSTRFGRIKLNCFHYQQAAEEALRKGELTQGIDSLKKVTTLLNKASPLPKDLKQQLISCQDLIDKTQLTLNDERENTGSKRLEEEFDKEEELDQKQDWQKKQLYDQ